MLGEIAIFLWGMVAGGVVAALLGIWYFYSDAFTDLATVPTYRDDKGNQIKVKSK